MAFGDKTERKKTLFEHLTRLVVLLMVLITVGGIVVAAYSALR